MTRSDLRRDLILATATAGLLALPLMAMAQAPPPAQPAQAVPTQSAPPESPVPARPTPDATGITPQGIMGTTPAQAPVTGTHPAPPTPATTGPVAANAADVTGLPAGIRASRIIGKNVRGAEDRTIGEIDDLMVPQGGGQPVAILSVGGFLGIGAHLVAVPYNQLTRTAGQNYLTLPNATVDSLKALPAFTYPENND
ncbi:PRC-barrel domain protein [Humitalea rosea]|uniref:PRC-barrel domain protein n=1 Tax=Humitalea rosea TaxID=990373 RepID=A0A2W7KFU1_9PROT|nr:PRC-barrel domain-containing protein [Humitalea rosea]PZW46539.1 PRC-barrel domain protein [Humitalea rosea]